MQLLSQPTVGVKDQADTIVEGLRKAGLVDLE